MNKTEINVFERVVLWSLTLLFIMLGLTVACDMVNQKSNVTVALGFGVFIVVISYIGVLLMRIMDLIFKSKWFKSIIGVFAFISVIAVSGCDFVPPGHVGVQVNLYGKNRGVQDMTLVTGRVWFNPWTTQIYIFPTYMQYKIWTRSSTEGSPNDESITFVTKDRIQVNVDVSTAYQFETKMIPDLFNTFRQPPEVIADTYIRSRVRDAFVRNGSELNAMDVLGSGIGTLDTDVQKTVNAEMASKGIHFDYISVIGHPRIPEQIQAAINAAIESTQQAQQAQNQVAVVKAQADQIVAAATGQAKSVRVAAEGEAAAILAKATAQAQANQMLAQSLTPDLIRYNAIKQWNGQVPKYSGGGAVPFLDINGK
jgi:regulator of protease activity HflC (stomatin/prohibitin superfamily)